MSRRYLATRFGVPVDHFDAALHFLDLLSLTALSDVAGRWPSVAQWQNRGKGAEIFPSPQWLMAPSWSV